MASEPEVEQRAAPAAVGTQFTVERWQKTWIELAQLRASELLGPLDQPKPNTKPGTVTDASMLDWVRRSWDMAGLRLEPSAAAAFAAVPLYLAAAREDGQPNRV